MFIFWYFVIILICLFFYLLILYNNIDMYICLYIKKICQDFDYIFFQWFNKYNSCDWCPINFVHFYFSIYLQNISHNHKIFIIFTSLLFITGLYCTKLSVMSKNYLKKKINIILKLSRCATLNMMSTNCFISWCH